MKATTHIQIRFADADAMGHTNNAKYFTYMEQARVALFKKVFDLKTGTAINPRHFPFILAEISCRFLAPTYVDQNLIVECQVTEIKNKSFIITYEMKDAGTGGAVATGTSVQVWYDYQAKKAIPIPEKYRGLFSAQSS